MTLRLGLRGDNRAAALLCKCATLDQAKAAAARRSDLLDPYALRFPSGEWLVIRAHDFHVPGLRAEWEGSVMVDSRGGLYTADHHFCGGFDELDDVSRTASLQQAREALAQLGFRPMAR
jgi:hypothetical protein